MAGRSSAFRPRRSSRRSDAGRAWASVRGEAGQAFVLAVLMLGICTLAALAVTGLALAYAGRAAAQSAADAAALACATQASVTDWVDARGRVYRRSVAVDPVAGPAAALGAWRANLAPWPIRTLGFTASPSGPACPIEGRVAMALGVLGILSRGTRTLVWTASAEARAYPAPPA